MIRPPEGERTRPDITVDVEAPAGTGATWVGSCALRGREATVQGVVTCIEKHRRRR